MPKEFPEIYFSYAWGDPVLGKESIEYFIDELYKSLKAAGYPLKRDKMDIGYGDLISDFMRDIGEADLVVIGISNKYLRSPYCMWELCEIYRNSSKDKQKFTPKLLPIRIENIDFNDLQVQKKYIDFWDTEFKNINQFITDHPDQSGITLSHKKEKIRTIRHDFINVTAYINDINSLTKALLQENDFERIKKEINSRTGLKPIKGDDFINGKIVHNIPKKMQVGVWTRCKIKIAMEISLFELDEDFKQGGFSKPDNLAISELMKVEIKGDASAFEITAVTDPEMYLEGEEATTWLYDVKPLRLGNHTLTLMAYTMREKGRRNSRYYEASIEVVTEGMAKQKDKVIDELIKETTMGWIPSISLPNDWLEKVEDSESRVDTKDESSNKPLKVFISYSHLDNSYRLKLQEFLTTLVQDKSIDIWSDTKIQTGTQWNNEISDKLSRSDIVILIVTQNLIKSKYINETELKTAITQNKTILPILAESCDWLNWKIFPERTSKVELCKSFQVASLQFLLPYNHNGEYKLVPIKEWQFPEKAWTSISQKIRIEVKNKLDKIQVKGNYFIQNSEEVINKIDELNQNESLQPVASIPWYKSYQNTIIGASISITAALLFVFLQICGNKTDMIPEDIVYKKIELKLDLSDSIFKVYKDSISFSVKGDNVFSVSKLLNNQYWFDSIPSTMIGRAVYLNTLFNNKIIFSINVYLDSVIKHQINDTIIQVSKISKIKSEASFVANLISSRPPTIPATIVNMLKFTQNTITVNNLNWTKYNLNLPIGSSKYHKDNIQYKERYGMLYTFKDADHVCRSLGKGWRLPSIKEWKIFYEYLIHTYVNINGQKDEQYKILLDKMPLDLNLGKGGVITKNGELNFSTNGYYWSKDELNSIQGYIVQFKQNGVSFDSKDELEKLLSCRCLREVKSNLYTLDIKTIIGKYDKIELYTHDLNIYILGISLVGITSSEINVEINSNFKNKDIKILLYRNGTYEIKLNKLDVNKIEL